MAISSQQIFKTSYGSDEAKKPLYRHLYFQVISAIIFGILLGHFYPSLGEQMKPLGDLFIKLVKLLIAPIIFCTVVHGIAGMNDIKRVGRVGIRSLIYFEVMTTIALVIGLVGMNLMRPGAGLNVDPATLNAAALASYASQAKSLNFVDYIMHIVPNTFFGAFADGDILQTLFVALLFAFGLHALGEHGRPVVEFIERGTHVFFGMMRIVMYVSPIGAFGAMAFTIGKYGVASLVALAHLLITFYIVCAIFVFGVLGVVAHLTGFSLWKFLRYIREELLLVLGTSSSETALPRLIAKLEVLGCEVSVCWPRGSGRVDLQPGRHLHQPDDDGDLRCPGYQYRTQPVSGNSAARGDVADIEGCCRHHRRSLRRIGRDTLLVQHDSGCQPGAGARCLPVHLRGRCSRQPDRQRGRDHRRRQVGRRSRREATAASAEQPGRHDSRCVGTETGLISDFRPPPRVASFSRPEADS